MSVDEIINIGKKLCVSGVQPEEALSALRKLLTAAMDLDVLKACHAASTDRPSGFSDFSMIGHQDWCNRK